MICIDSTCIVDFFKRLPEAVKIIERYKDEIATTEISVFEVMYGVYLKNSDKEKELSNNFFDSILVLPFDSGCGNISAEILSSLSKKGEIIDQNDVFIASIMIKKGCDKIITKNTKHFSKIKGLKVISY